MKPGPMKKNALVSLAISAALMLSMSTSVHSQGQPGAGAAAIAKAVGTIKSVQADSITVDAESGGEITAKLSPTTKMLRVPPGEKDLKNATPVEIQDLQPGDRVLVRGQASPDARTITALAVIVMKQADVSAQHQQQTEDWQKRGVGGLVTRVDPAADTITISSGTLMAKREIVIHVNKETILRRYAEGSVKFDDAKPAPIDQIKTGDQLRARGARSADGNELTAEEIVSGTFRNIAGTITAIDAANNSMTVHDLIAKNEVTVKISSDSQMKKIPAEMAQRIAMRLKGGAGAASGGQAGAQVASTQTSTSSGGGFQRSSGAPGNGTAGPGGNAAPDIQRILTRMPNSSLADLQKGEAVMIVSTDGTGSGTVTAITLLAGVEPILTASPNQNAYSLLSPWSLSPSGGEGEAAP
jgi:hypothetical protein